MLFSHPLPDGAGNAIAQNGTAFGITRFQSLPTHASSRQPNRTGRTVWGQYTLSGEK